MKKDDCVAWMVTLSGTHENLPSISGLCLWAIISDALIVDDHVILTGPKFSSTKLTKFLKVRLMHLLPSLHSFLRFTCAYAYEYASWTD